MLTNTTIRNALAGLSLGAALVSPPAAHAQKPVEGQALAERYLACWDMFNKADWNEFIKCYDAGSVSVAPGLPDAKGAKAIVELHGKGVKTAMPDAAGTVQLVLASGRHAATVALFRGTNTGPLIGPGGEIPATNKKVGQLVAHAIESGPKSVAMKEWFIQDGGTMMGQLGLSKLPHRPAIQKAAERPSVVIGSNSKTEQQNLAGHKKVYAAFNKRDKAMFDLFADDIVDRDQCAPADLVGKAAVVGFVQAFQKMSSNIKAKPATIFAAGDYTVAVGQFAGTNDGVMPEAGITTKTGKAFKMDVIEILRWQDGKIKEVWPFVNGMQLAMQLGLMPAAPKTAQK